LIGGFAVFCHGFARSAKSGMAGTVSWLVSPAVLSGFAKLDNFAITR
jgi:hypothetical protein